MNLFLCSLKKIKISLPQNPESIISSSIFYLISNLLCKLGILFSISFFFIVDLNSQVDNINAEYPVYHFLKKMQVKGVLKYYDDMILPISRKEIAEFIFQLDKNRENLSSADREFLDRVKVKLILACKEAINVFDSFPNEFINNVIADDAKHLYYFVDSSASFFIDPYVEYRFINSSKERRAASLLSYGGSARGSFGDWLSFFVKGTNGVVFGNRSTAILDKRVQQSFSFNDTKINFFDETEGYIKLHQRFLNFQIGRERILWGRGYLNKMILSNNPQIFDFIKFDISYKKLKYDFIHAWLVQPKSTIFIDSLSGEGKIKPSKYLAASRLSYSPSSNVSLGISQIIIYANRPFEAAYLNPFLLWESAQRSLNDLDNSFLSLDGRYRITDGFELSSALLIDDIHFGEMLKNWATIHNRIAWQAGAMLTSPLTFENLTLKIEYLQVRPYIFIHPGFGESLTYTNNGYLLGFDLPPNSVRLSSAIDYRFSGRFSLSARYDHSIHGNNIYDSQGNIIKNVGGNIYENNDINDSAVAYLLDGNRDQSDFFKLSFRYEFLYGFYLDAEYQFLKNQLNGKTTNQSIFFGSVIIDF